MRLRFLIAKVEEEIRIHDSRMVTFDGIVEETLRALYNKLEKKIKDSFKINKIFCG